MSKEELRYEIEDGVVFWRYEEDGQLIAVMGNQPIQDVVLIRHAYVRTARQNQGIGSRLLSELLFQINRPILIGTWADASRAIRFYENMVSDWSHRKKRRGYRGNTGLFRIVRSKLLWFLQIRSSSVFKDPLKQQSLA